MTTVPPKVMVEQPSTHATVMPYFTSELIDNQAAICEGQSVPKLRISRQQD